VKQKQSQSPWDNPPKPKVEIDMSQFCNEWVQNYEKSEKLLRKTVGRLEAGEDVTSDDLRELFESTSVPGVEEIERVKVNGEQTPEERKRREQVLLYGCSLNLERHLRAMPVQERLKNSGQSLLPEPKITPGKSIKEIINFLNDIINKKK